MDQDTRAPAASAAGEAGVPVADRWYPGASVAKSSAGVAGLSAGSVIAGKYRLLSLVAEGGMGVVWRAEDLLLAAPVAIKLLHARNLHEPETRARFEAEAAIGAQLRSPHVVQIFERGVDRASGLPFIAMELLEGESLQERLERAGPLATRELVRVVSQVAQALTRAHALGIVHRDLKPANIFLVREGDTQLAKVLDFGIAKRLSSTSTPARTLTGNLLGTPTYMSPEQLMGSRRVDHRSDLWSLGVIAVECLTGRLPFEADHLAGLALAICQGRYLLPSSLAAVPPGFDAWFLKASASAAEARFDSAALLAEALRQVCEVEGNESDAAPDGHAAAPAVPVDKATRAPAPGPDPTVQLPGAQRVRARRSQRRLLWFAAGGALLLVALSVLLPERPSTSATASTRSAVFRNAPAAPATPSPTAALPAPGVQAISGGSATSGTPLVAEPLAPPAPASSTGASVTAGAAGAAALPARVTSRPPRAGASPPVQERSTSPAPARPPAPLDPDNLGF